MDSVKDKNILLFVPDGRGNYGSAIEKHLIERGAKVYIYDERPSKKSLSKIANRLFSNYLEPLNKRYFRQIINNLVDIHFDYVLFIRGEVLTNEILNLFRNKLNANKYILYLWDSLKNNDKRNVFKSFDDVFSFDRIDCEVHNIKFRPLFFTESYDQRIHNYTKDIDVLFIGTLHSNRYCFISEVKSTLSCFNLVSYFYLYLQTPLLFYKLKFKYKCMRSAKIEEINFKPLPMNAVAEQMLKSKVTLDLQSPSQSGLTMRTIEALGSGTKLVTTNSDIIHYDFYNKENILVLRNGIDELNANFFSSNYRLYGNEIYEKYSLKGWINDVFALNS